MLNKVDREFHNLYQRILGTGALKEDRTGVGTIMLPAQMMRFDCSGGKMPILSTRKIHTRSFIHEMLWFISGTSSIKYLRDNKVGIWDSWFIPGSDKYDEPQVKHLSVETRLKLPEALAQWEAIDAKLDGLLAEMQGEGSAHLELTMPNGKVLEYNNLTGDTYKTFSLWLDTIGVPVTTQTGGSVPISLQRRLARVSKNDTEKWDRINDYLIKNVLTSKVYTGASDYTTVTIFSHGVFLDVELSSRKCDGIWNILDELKVPAYELLDADIGQGGYGPQWRKWQDTQMVDVHDTALRDEYLKQGYAFKGYMYGEDGGEDALILHRNIDQLQNVIEKLKSNPDDRRMIVTAHNPGRTWQAALPPCHLYFQFTTSSLSTLADLEGVITRHGMWKEYIQRSVYQDIPGPDDVQWFVDNATNFCKKKGLPLRKISMTVVLRSNDVPLGAVFNVAQYALLLHMVGLVVNMEPDELITVGVDSHIYMNQVDQVRELLALDSPVDSDPRVVFKRKVDSIDDFTFDDIEITGYVPGPDIKIPVAV